MIWRYEDLHIQPGFTSLTAGAGIICGSPIASSLCPTVYVEGLQGLPLWRRKYHHPLPLPYTRMRQQSTSKKGWSPPTRSLWISISPSRNSRALRKRSSGYRRWISGSINGASCFLRVVAAVEGIKTTRVWATMMFGTYVISVIVYQSQVVPFSETVDNGHCLSPGRYRHGYTASHFGKHGIFLHD
jgi:hypothetical protein